MPAWRILLLALGVLLLASWLGWDGSRESAPRDPAGLTSPHAQGLDAEPGHTLLSGNEIHVSRLPAEGRHTLALIRQGGPFAYAKDGTTFSNREGLLPSRGRGYYREYTVPTPGAGNRGARRIVAGQDGNYWYTDDHYQSFRRIRE